MSSSSSVGHFLIDVEHSADAHLSGAGGKLTSLVYLRNAGFDVPRTAFVPAAALTRRPRRSWLVAISRSRRATTRVFRVEEWSIDSARIL